MCIALWSLDHPAYSLILAANRDEYLSRQTEGPRWRTLQSSTGREADVLCGLDLEAGGTWLGLSQTGRLALLTNIREEAPPSGKGKRPSRGNLVRDILVDGPTVLGELDLTEYAGFNLLSGQLGGSEADLQIDTNRPYDTRKPAPARLEGREPLGGISNGAYEHLDAASEQVWPKLQSGSASLRGVVDGLSPTATLDSADALVDQLFAVVSAASPRFDAQHPQTVPHTVMVPPLSMPLPQIDLFPAASHPPAHAPKWYATRSQAIVLVDRNGEALFVAREAYVLSDSGEPVWSGRETERCRINLSTA